MNYYAVTCKCGHVGRNYYIPITFPIMANDAKEAASKGRMLPRVKHHHKFCILSVYQIKYEEYLILLNTNNSDPYLCCKNKQDQNRLDLSSRILIDKDNMKKNRQCNKADKRIFVGKTEVRNPKKYLRLYQLSLE